MSNQRESLLGGTGDSAASTVPLPQPQGRAEPLPLLKPSSEAARGTGVTLPYVKPPANEPQGRAEPLPSLTPDVRRDKDERPIVYVQRAVAERAIELMRNAYVETRNMTAAPYCGVGSRARRDRTLRWA